MSCACAMRFPVLYDNNCPGIEVRATHTDQFVYTATGTRSSFLRDAKAAISGLRASTSRVWRMSFARPR